MFGGKGGVGKTTCAAAWALDLAERGARVLALSTDPAHSLGDALGVRLTPRPARVRTRAGRLDACELDAPRAVSRWLARHRPQLSRVIEEGTLLDREDVERLLDLPLPGIDELAGFLALAAIERGGRYPCVVIDAAPTGHARRLLEMPVLVGRLAALLEAMADRRDAVARALGGRASRRDVVDELRREGEAAMARLRDAARTAMLWVTLPEPLAVRETVDAMAWLRRERFPLATLILNGMSPDGSTGCGECRARRAVEREALAPLVTPARTLALRVVTRRSREPRGPAALRAIAADLRVPRTWRDVTRSPAPARAVVRSAGPAAAPFPLFPLGTSLVFFGGKGGVGKTTCAAAAALACARAQPRRLVRLISTDPAPSLAAVLRLRAGDRWTRVPGPWRLDVRELDAAALFARFRERYLDAVRGFFTRLTGGAFDAPLDRAVIERAFDLAPPGIDEVMALLSVADPGGEDRDALVIVDTAPAGHTVRLLALPAAAQQWVGLLMRLVVKYRLTARAESLARDLLRLSRGIRAFRERLADPAQARFVTVVRPAALPRLESERLLADLRRLRIATPTVVLNAATGGDCPGCRARARAESIEAATIRRACAARARRARRAGCDIMQAPLRLPPPSGARELLDWAGAWRLERRRGQTRGS